MKSLALLCDVIGDVGGAERYWATVTPELARFYDVRVFGRDVTSPDFFGVRATRIDWSDEHGEPSDRAAARVSEAVRGCDAVITANVLDAGVLHAARTGSRKWIARVHDHRPFCPNGNKVFPQFPAVCRAPMGAACVLNAVLRGCVHGARASSLRDIVRRSRVRDALAQADDVLVSSKYMRDLCSENGIPAHAIRIAPPPIAQHYFDPPVRLPGKGVLYFGRLTEEKGIFSLVRALAGIDRPLRPPLTVASRGTATQEKDLRALAAASGVELHWRGWLGQEQLRDAIDGARVVALPSLWPEPFGLAGTQAMVRGRPVVAYDVGGVGDWIEGAGIAVPRGDEPALGSALAQLCSKEDEWSRYSQNALEKAEAYRVSRHLERLRSIIEDHEERLN